MRSNRYNDGFVEVDILMSAAIIAIVITTIIGSLIYTRQSMVVAADRMRASMLAEEAFAAVESIRDEAWNDLVYTQSAVEITGGEWEFTGESTTETIGKFTRTIDYFDVCRDSSDDIVTCPGEYTDPHTKRVHVTLEWDAVTSRAQSMEFDEYLTTWGSAEWTQTDWIGGSGQATWSDETMYDSDDGGVTISPSGQVTLATVGGTCAPAEWPFTSAGNYTYNSSDIEVTSGFAQLLASAGAISGITTPFLDAWEYETSNGETPSFLQIADDVWAVAYDGPGSDGYVATFTIDDAGAITTTAIDTLEFDASTGLEPELFQVSGTTYAVAYRGSGDDGFIKTFTISAGGAISTVIDTLEFDTSTGREPSVVSVGGDIFAIAYRGDGSDGYLATVDIDSSGNIENSVIDTLEYDTENGETPSIVSIGGEIYGIAYQGAGDDGFVVTVEIDSSGNITKTILGELEYDTANGETPDSVHVNGSIYAVAYEGAGSDGFVATVDIAAGGSIAGSTIDVLEFDTSQGLYPDIEHVSGDVYLIAYAGPGNDGFLVTVDIDGAGSIENSVIDEYEYDTSAGLSPDITHISGDVYAVAYRGGGNDGFVRTFNVSTSGTITSSAIDSLEYNTSDGRHPSMTHVSGDIYAIAYRSSGSDGFLTTIDIDSAGNIENSVIETWEFDTSNGERPHIVPISGDIYAIAYQGAGDDGFLITVDIDNTGDITASAIDTFEFDTTFTYTPRIMPISGDVYAIAYEGNGSDGFLITLEISSSGVITTPVIETLEFDTANGEYPDILNISGDTYAIFYDGSGTDGFVRTFSIGTDGDIGSGVIDTHEFDTGYAYTPDMVQVDSDTYAIAYEGGSNSGELVTITINANGSIDDSNVDTFTFDASNGEYPSLVNVSGDTYAIAYSGPGTGGWLALIDITSAGDIAAAITDSYEFDTDTATWPAILIEDNTVYIVYEGSGNDGYITTIGLETSSSYPTDEPDIYPTSPYSSGGVGQWTGFTETAVKNGGRDLLSAFE